MTHPRTSTPSPAVSVLVADRTRATLYRVDGNSELVESEVLIHPQSRLRDHDLVSDAPGLSIGARYPRGSPTQPSSPHEREAERFAQQIGRRLAELRATSELDRLYLVAEPHFLGRLRAALDEP
ncbi:MAG: host attachment protein, partial [Gammaproteobacteria bacterium]